ncbi:PHP domain-containing protein [Mangrovitalea sediminis]|uniref:PHP domain-containing protein n=1 Tax=Mangrovitalea sediminis TaxID=1982043 RepID=UPI001D0CF414|nr:PHP domain-containing protein [Mangrovitalea sediminis]
MQANEAINVRMCADFHAHSTASDGTLTPRELVARAAEVGVTHFALTDHDTIAGLEEAAAAAEEHGIRLINGIELSCVWRTQTIHIVGLDFDAASADFQALLSRQEAMRWDRARLIASRLQKAGLPDLLATAEEEAGGGVPGRPHFASAMVREGCVDNLRLAFSRYLGAGKVGDVTRYWPELSAIVEGIVNAGGQAVLAHPKKYRMTATKLRALLADFQAAGGVGLEVLTSGQSSGDTGFLAELCRRNGCLASVGSDFHFPGAAWCELGRLPALPEGLQPIWERFRALNH